MIASVDADASQLLAALHAQAFDRPWSATEMAKLLENPAAFGFISPAAEPVGFILGWAAAGEAEILTVAVAPEARRRGVGEQLAIAAAAAAAARGAQSVHLEVAENNVAARALYAKLGYQQAGRRSGYYLGEGRQIDAIVMRADLRGVSAVDSASR
jgi:ribosomal-protein-alanine N-acetyltransferase